jgi:hypothetical protein
MFTPEFTAKGESEFHLIANHSIGFEESRSLSVEYVRFRVEFGRKNVPDPDARFVVHYDIRGQKVPDDIEDILAAELAGICEVVVKRK